MNRIKRFFSVEGAKLKSMDARDRRWYLWEYYKFHAFIGLLIILMLAGMVDAWVINKQKATYLQIAWLSTFHGMDELPLMANVLTDAIVTDKTREAVLVTSFTLTGVDHAYDNAIQQRFVALLAARELHAMIVEDESDVLRLAEAELLRPVDDIMEHVKSIDGELYERLSPMLVDGNLAIPLAESKLLARLEIPSENLYLCKVVTEGYDYETARALVILYE
jgi:hypothetical protein